MCSPGRETFEKGVGCEGGELAEEEGEEKSGATGRTMKGSQTNKEFSFIGGCFVVLL